MSLSIITEITDQVATSDISYCYLYEPLRVQILESIASADQIFIELEVLDSSNTAVVIETLTNYGEFDINSGQELTIDLMEIAQQHHDANLFKFQNIDEIANNENSAVVSKYVYNFKITSSNTITPIEIKKLPIIGGRTFQDFKPAVNFTNKISTVTNGSFDTDVSWNKVNNFTISGGKGVVISTDLTKSQIFQASTGTSGVLTKVKFTISDFSGTGNAQLRYPLIVNITGNGTYEAEGIGESVLRTQFDATADNLATPLTFKVDDVSVYPALDVEDRDYLDEISKQEIDLYSKWNGLQFLNIDLANLASGNTDKSPTITKVINSNLNNSACEGQIIWKSRLGGWCSWGFTLKREKQESKYTGNIQVGMFEAYNGNAFIPVDYTGIETSYSITLKDLSLSSAELRAVQSLKASPAVYYMPDSTGRLELMRIASVSAPLDSMANGGDFSVTLNSISRTSQKTR